MTDMVEWTDGVATIAVPDNVPTGHLAALGWERVNRAPSPAPEPTGEKLTDAPAKPRPRKARA